MLQTLVDPKLLKGVEDILGPVSMVPLKELGIDIPVKSAINHAILSRGKIVQFCSEDYGLRTNESILIHFLRFLKDKKMPVHELVGHNHMNSRFRMDIVLNFGDSNVTKSVNDPLKVGLRIYNSYDGSQKYQFSTGIYRLVCSNGLSVLDEEVKIRKTHTSSVYDGDDLQEAEDHILNTIKSLTPMMDIYNDLADYPVRNLELRMEEVAEGVGYPRSLIEEALDRAHEEIAMGYPSSDWVVYNSMNYMLNHGNSALIGRKFEALDKAILNFLVTC